MTYNVFGGTLNFTLSIYRDKLSTSVIRHCALGLLAGGAIQVPQLQLQLALPRRILINGYIRVCAAVAPDAIFTL